MGRDILTIRHSIRVPSVGPDPSRVPRPPPTPLRPPAPQPGPHYLLRSGSHFTAAGPYLSALRVRSLCGGLAQEVCSR